MYRADGRSFFTRFRGDYSGILCDKAQRSWTIYTNPTGTKPFFYFIADDQLILASDLAAASTLVRQAGHKTTLDTMGAYLMLTYGYMLSDVTLVSEIRRLRPGHMIKYESGKSSVEQYHRFTCNDLLRCGKQEIIEEIDRLFANAIHAEYKKDQRYGFRHLAMLSAGLDSRMNSLVAHDLGYEPVTNMTFSKNDYYDDWVPKKIAADLGHEWLFYSLEHGNYVVGAAPLAVLANSGLVVWTGAAHMLAMENVINFGPFGVMHSGEIGDGILGGFISGMEARPALPGRGAYSRMLLPKIESEIEQLLADDENEEISLLYGRGFNCAMNGTWLTYFFTEYVSPFMDQEFIEFCLRIPPALKLHEQIYLDWIAAKHRSYGRYVWEKIKTRPTDSRLSKYMHYLIWKVQSRGLNLGHKFSMNPFDHWCKVNPALRQYFDSQFQANQHLLDDHPGLRDDCAALFRTGRATEKAQVMTVLEGAKLLLGN